VAPIVNALTLTAGGIPSRLSLHHHTTETPEPTQGLKARQIECSRPVCSRGEQCPKVIFCGSKSPSVFAWLANARPLEQVLRPLPLLPLSLCPAPLLLLQQGLHRCPFSHWINGRRCAARSRHVLGLSAHSLLFAEVGNHFPLQIRNFAIADCASPQDPRAPLSCPA
jgi:hypothetical protein